MINFSKALTPGLCMALALTVGCSSTGETQQGGPAVENRNTLEGPTANDATTQAVSPATPDAGNPLDDPSSILSTRVVYFAYDSSEVSAQDQAVVEAHANYLLQNPGQRILLEGHADERGSREYNIALGERRALSVARMMQLLGVADSQIRSVSYGEERPSDAGHDEAAWTQNRRVELVYRRPGQS
jgi:peptidoglycan-associated lipoprotein